MSQYKEGKKKLPWGVNPAVSYVTEKVKKEMGAKYDPILQRYNDSSTEEVTRVKEQHDFVHTLAKNKVLSRFNARLSRIEH